MKPSILIIEDEQGMREFLSIFLESLGYDIQTAPSGEKGLQLFKEEIFDLVVTDLRLPGFSGLDVLKKVREMDPDALVIIITAFATTETTVKAMKEGAFDYITKPFNNDQIKLIVEKALSHRSLSRENRLLRQQLDSKYQFENVIGRSNEMERIFDVVRKVRDLDSTVLLVGESGTGKEMIAKAIHYSSTRTRKPFVTVNCGALPENLLESELFGHVRGSFTGAISNKEGLLEVADGGTFFLDEVGETTPAIQVKLLRFLQERTFKRVGGTKDVSVDVRVIAATNADLEKAVAENRFREDLYYRLNVIQLRMPPLRDRKEDIPLLVSHFLSKFLEKQRKPPKQVSPEAMECLVNYAWPGNVRQLENVIERAVALESSPTITVDSLPQSIRQEQSTASYQITQIPNEGIDFQALVDEFEKDILLKAFKKANYVKKDTAELLNISFRSLRYRLEKFGIDKS